MLGADFHFDMVRPGLSLYGMAADDVPDARLSPVATLEARILQTRDVAVGETVGYGGEWTATRPTRAAIIGLGYGDGVLRANYPGGGVWIDSAVRPFIGRLSMDLAAIDVTGCDAAKPGAWVELFGARLPIEDVARRAGTIGYEILASVGAHVKPVYRGA
jgi:alanine racemase